MILAHDVVYFEGVLVEANTSKQKSTGNEVVNILSEGTEGLECLRFFCLSAFHQESSVTFCGGSRDHVTQCNLICRTLINSHTGFDCLRKQEDGHHFFGVF